MELVGLAVTARNAARNAVLVISCLNASMAALLRPAVGGNWMDQGNRVHYLTPLKS